MTRDDINRAEWADPSNWGDGPRGLYFSKRDARPWVPKRAGGPGWTPNFGHRHAALWLLGMVLLPALLIGLLWGLDLTLGTRGALAFLGAVFVPSDAGLPGVDSDRREAGRTREGEGQGRGTLREGR